MTRKAAVLATWRAARTPRPWFELVGLLRWGACAACAVAVVSTAFSFARIRPVALDAWDYARIIANRTYDP